MTDQGLEEGSKLEQDAQRFIVFDNKKKKALFEIQSKEGLSSVATKSIHDSL